MSRSRKSSSYSLRRSVCSTSPVPVSPKPRTPKVPKGVFLTQKELSNIDLNLSVASVDAKHYMDQKCVPQMLRSLFCALMVEKPDDPLKYLDHRLEEIRAVGAENVEWQTFIKHMHPSRAPTRLAMLHTTGNEPVKHSREDSFVHEGKYPYNPDVFRLTEMMDSDEEI